MIYGPLRVLSLMSGLALFRLVACVTAAVLWVTSGTQDCPVLAGAEAWLRDSKTCTPLLPAWGGVPSNAKKTRASSNEAKVPSHCLS